MHRIPQADRAGPQSGVRGAVGTGGFDLLIKVIRSSQPTENASELMLSCSSHSFPITHTQKHTHSVVSLGTDTQTLMKAIRSLNAPFSPTCP